MWLERSDVSVLVQSRWTSHETHTISELTAVAESRPTGIAETVPWAETVTDYDRAHAALYLRLLDACAKNTTILEMAEVIFGLDPLAEPARATQIVTSHMRRAEWMATQGYRHLMTKD